MKKIKCAILAFATIVGLCTTPIQANAEEYVNIKSYTEVFTPVNDKDAQLDVTVTGTAGEDGYLYVIASVKGMEVTEVTGENLDGTQLEAYKEGSASYYRIPVADASAEATVEVTFNCPGFYDVARSADTNGGEDYKMSYKFTNYLVSKMGSYNVTIFVPEGNEIVKVSSPSAYADYILSEQNGLRGAGVSKALAASTANTLTFTYDAAQSVGSNILVWVVCLGIGGFVFFDRYKKAGK